MPVLAAFMLDALDDLDRAVMGLSSAEAERDPMQGSSITWTLLHLAQHIDSWVIGGIAGQQRNEWLASEAFRRGGTGTGVTWPIVHDAFIGVEQIARSIIQTTSDEVLSQERFYSGSVRDLQGRLLTGNYRLTRLVAHIYYHIGEITTLRAGWGHQVEDFPSLLPYTQSAGRGSAL